jgi:lysophospholipase L1-like esterase
MIYVLHFYRYFFLQATPRLTAAPVCPPRSSLPLKETTSNVPGWGDDFLNNTLESPAFGINHGVSGASMPSYRAGGYWATVLSQVKTYKTTHEVFMTIQFGHNDQKVPAYETAYSANVKQFVLDKNNAGGIPVRHSHLASPKGKRRYSKGERK